MVSGNIERGKETWKIYTLKMKPKGLTCKNDQALIVSK